MRGTAEATGRKQSEDEEQLAPEAGGCGQGCIAWAWRVDVISLDPPMFCA